MAKRTKSSGPAFIKKGREAVEQATEGNGQIWLKLADGDSFEIVAIGGVEEIISFDQHAFWLDEGNSPIFPCLQSDDCPGCMLKNDPRFKAIMPIMIKNDGGQQERLIIFGKAVMRALADAEDAVGDSLHGHILRYSRKGSGMTTKYAVIPTGRTAKVPTIEEFALQPIDHIGPTTREEIIDVLREAKLWKSEHDKPKRAAKETEPVSESWDDEEFVDIEDEE